jgi:pre-mRNA-splicing factor CDC5/CEF1
MPLVVKGGVWKNTEDEILKAAVSKYGMNQWARISSLLAAKTPKQCKARWYEWLDPSIKKTEWSREEDEKLLHAAKIWPTQWRTIAQRVGRTATQCLERYQRLLDEAEAHEQGEPGLSLGGPGDEAGAAYDDIRKLRPGEIDPDPETRKALPDPVDMDEDEKEMLSEARARLANTQGKKAKRKARERQLDDSRRLAILQKRRELKAAGINTKLDFRRRGDMDYNADIPFEIKPAAGFYDTTEEQVHGLKEQGMIDMSKIQANKRRIAEQDEQRGKRPRRAVRPPQEEEAAAEQRAKQLQRLKAAEQLARRRPLNLPTPQVSEAEMEDIVKMGLSGESVRGLVDELGTTDASRGLLSDYSRMGTTPARTPMTPASRMTHYPYCLTRSEDRLYAEARNLRAMTQTQSSLLGGENTPLHDNAGTGFSAVPQRDAISTPNPLAPPLRNGVPLKLGTTPLHTPRDTLSLNEAYGGDTEKLARQKLQSRLAALPKPKNDYELVLPDEDEDECEVMEEQLLGAEDAEERDRRLHLAYEAEQLAILNRRSQVLKRDLPRPKLFSAAGLLAEVSKTADRIERMVGEEMARLILFEASKYPLPNAKPVSGPADFDEFSAEEMSLAHADVERELGELGSEIEWDEKEDVDVISIPLSVLEASLKEAAPAGNKLEKKLSLTLGGYLNRQGLLSGKIKEVVDAIEQAKIDLEVYRLLQAGEQSVAPVRASSLREEVEKLERRERDEQRKYKELSQLREQLLQEAAEANGQ